MQLPEKFKERMKELLQDEYEDFLASYEKKREYGLRFNTLKDINQELTEMVKDMFGLEKIAWCDTGYYYDESARPGKHGFHEAGLYYIQEPSAMITAELAQVEPGMKVLDLCAAPGGKSTQLACKLQGEGLLISNEINTARAAILSQNIERMGVKNAIVTNESPKDMAKQLPEFFQCIVVDAPCSGEGMFKKEENAIVQWSEENVRLCAKRQEEILDCAATMLLPGGKLCYSTCTFALEENELQIEGFLERHPEFILLEHHRIWPHKQRGEGHFAALLQKEGDCGFPEKLSGAIKKENIKGRNVFDKQQDKLFWEFLRENFSSDFVKGIEERKEDFLLFGDKVFLLPQQSPNLKGMKVVRPGLQIGTFKKNRFEPAHSLSHALSVKDFQRVINLKKEEEQVTKYLKGESMDHVKVEKGWCLVCVEGIPLGFGKVSNGICKNHYPKGLRI